MSKRLIEKAELESGAHATLKIERIVLSPYAKTLLRAQPSTTGDASPEPEKPEDTDISAGLGKAIAPGS